jgi:hypothetical protein
MSLFRAKNCTTAFVVILGFIVLAAGAFFLFSGELKNIVLAELSDRAGSGIGQKVSIGDISFRYPDELHIFDVEIHNPEYFQRGNLLTINEIVLKADLKPLLSGHFSFREIIVLAPEVMLMRNKDGRMNISGKLLNRFSQRTSSQYSYEIDRLRVISGMFGFQHDDRYRNRLHLDARNISSDPATKTLIRGGVAHDDSGEIFLNGWLNMQGSPKKFDIAIESKDYRMTRLKHFFDIAKLDISDAKADMTLSISGDTDRGARMISQIALKDVTGSFLKKKAEQLLLQIDVFFDFSRNSVSVQKAVVGTAERQAFLFKGEIRNVRSDCAYQGEMQIQGFNLSDIVFQTGLRIGGIISSEKVRFAGRCNTVIPEMSGSVRLEHGYIQSETFDLDDLQAQVELSHEHGLTAGAANISARIHKARTVSLYEPVDVDMSVFAQEKSKKISLTSDIAVSPVQASFGKEKSASLSKSRLTLDGVIADSIFSAQVAFASDDMTYGRYSFSHIEGEFGIRYADSIFSLKDLQLSTKKYAGSFGSVEIKGLKDKRQLIVQMKNIRTAYSSKEITLKAADVSLYLETAKPISGNFNFSDAAFLIRDKETARLSGNGTFDAEKLLISIPGSLLAGGTVRLQVKGTPWSSLLPLSVDVHAADLDLSVLSDIGAAFTELPYVLSGEIGRARFHGSIHAIDALDGTGSFRAEHVSVFGSEGKRMIIKDVSINGVLTATGEDIEFQTETSVDMLSSNISGNMRGFLSEERTYQLNILVPETGINDIRNSFWSIFPDRLLYAGLEGTMQADLDLLFDSGGITIDGDLRIKGLVFEQEFGKYAVGPINGSIPISYNQKPAEQVRLKMPDFDRTVFEKRLGGYSAINAMRNYSKISIGSFRYGFRLITDIVLWARQDGALLNIASISGNIFRGKLYGSSIIDISDGPRYHVGLVLKGLSLSDLCDSIEPIRGYISGKVDGVAHLKGSGAHLDTLIGKADFWTYSDTFEKTMISKEFLRKVGGPSVRAYLGNRSFDKGVMSLYMKEGFFIFSELEISNRNLLGIKDLSLKVAPLNNRIAIDHFMWTITEAAQRAKENKR